MLSTTNVIIVITCLLSFISFQNYKIQNALIFWPPAIGITHQYYRFITGGLIHKDIFHLAFNMISLFFFGRVLDVIYRGELGLKWYYYPILYFSALIVSQLPSYFDHKDDYNYYSLGASGAVCAVMFANILIFPWQTVQVYFAFPIPSILFAVLFLGFTVYMDKRGKDNVNHNAHLWGALYGMVFTMLVRPSIISHFINELKHPRWVS